MKGALILIPLFLSTFGNKQNSFILNDDSVNQCMSDRYRSSLDVKVEKQDSDGTYVSLDKGYDISHDNVEVSKKGNKIVFEPGLGRSKIEITKEDETKIIYFYNDGEFLYESYSSYEEAELKALDSRLSSTNMTLSEYKESRQKIHQSEYYSDFGVITTPTPSFFSFSGKLNWKDDSNVTHPLQNSKNVIQTKASGSTDWLDKSTGYTDTDGYFKIFYEPGSNMSTRVVARSCGRNTMVGTESGDVKKPEDNIPYEVVLNPSDDPLNYRNKICAYTFTMANLTGKMFQLSQELIAAAEYGKYLNDGNYLPYCGLVTYGYDPDNSGDFYRSSERIIHVQTISYRQKKPRWYSDWDVIGHEYGHHLQDSYPEIGVTVSELHYPGKNCSDFLWDSYRGVYSLNTAKQAGVWQTWKEGFATYFGQRVQKYLQDTLIDIPYVNDEKYTAANGVEHSMIGKLYPGENSKGGESNETVVCQVLYQITDILILVLIHLIMMIKNCLITLC